ncbi:hypothetical protein Emtol_1011 [Emticicia oligotrophica DSM 17448]|uniref:DUF4177 domain-containing protein n=1 Tax=Emticicia oligotrophica (strain DSM 17448 / CIP 109782 / MTCC 6937 / GPTSA100-15) TaxID=929562 RepID=A0ABN4AJ79_EMTOG|nr:DUF4177 domain-containing protein [Emticicia oligotrophica]AFK02162.1 hypothetical protein Emtol_1011 [Emticicia oligotrophica DSM 17448]
MPKWEYRTLTVNRNETNKFIDRLNTLGEEGWELISTFTIESKSVGLFDSGSETSGIVAVLKREKE